VLKGLGTADAVRFLELLDALPILVEQESPARMLKEAMALAREQILSTYEASCLDLAMRLGLPIATQDTHLLEAAQRIRMRRYDPADGKTP